MVPRLWINLLVVIDGYEKYASAFCVINCNLFTIFVWRILSSSFVYSIWLYIVSFINLFCIFYPFIKSYKLNNVIY